MNIIKTIQCLFPLKDKSEKTKSNVTPINIEFLLDNDGEPHIKISILDTSHDFIQKFAEMIFHINEGGYAHNMLEVLGEMSQQDKEIHGFIRLVLVAWKKLKDEKSQNLLEPKIKPTDFFRSLNNGS